MARKLQGTAKVSEVTRFKEAWRKHFTAEDKDWFFDQFSIAGQSTAQARALIRERFNIHLKYDSQISGDDALLQWCFQERQAEQEAELQLAEEREEQEKHPDWTKEQIRDSLLRKMYRRAERSGEWKLGLAAIKQDAALEAVELDRQKFKEGLRTKLEAGLEALAADIRSSPEAVKLYDQMRALIANETK